MNCDEFRAAVLAGEEDGSTAAHLESCPACRSRTASLRGMQDVLGQPVLWEEPSPELGSQVSALIGSARNSAVSEGSRGRRWWLVGAAAVLLAMVVGSLVLTGGPAPDWEAALPATDRAPNATAVVQGWNEAAGTRMVLDVDGLAPAPDGYMYEFWLSDGPRHISAGTFRSGGQVELWAGVRRADFPRLWITLEPLDEDESPSEHTLLDSGYRG
jgi:hypothetical protein